MDPHPYAALAPERFWRRAVADMPPFAIDPGRPSDFRLTRTERIATAGSCFAQQVARALSASGCNFHVTEPALGGGPESAFSAQYGNVYTTRQLMQLFDRAFGRFSPEIAAWERPNGRFVDPFRPRMHPAGFASPDEVAADRTRHLGCVRTLFETLDTLVLTLGLTEGWRHVEGDVALPLPPGIAGGTWDPDRYRFVNATVPDMIDDMLRFVDGIRSVNAGARIVLTVSPVPIAATYTDRHVLVASTYSKSALRVVAEMACGARPDVHYFPSYEIVVAPQNVGRYLAENLRSVTPAGIAHVMRCFMRHVDELAPAPRAQLDVRRESLEAAGIICDEDLLDA